MTYGTIIREIDDLLFELESIGLQEQLREFKEMLTPEYWHKLGGGLGVWEQQSKSAYSMAGLLRECADQQQRMGVLVKRAIRDLQREAECARDSEQAK